MARDARSLAMRPLPIDDALAPLRHALARHASVVLHAPPGAGKTTRVPLALLDEPWLAGQRLVLLEPRRLAARAAARRMAETRGEPVGATVGVRTRGETRVSGRTRIEVVTEGVLTRMLLHDPTLEHVGLVLFDEFHERSLQGDVGLALALESQSVVRPDLRLLVMSATLDVAAVAALLGDAPVIASEGRAYPVETRYRPRPAGQSVEGAVAAAVRHALRADEGSILAFLPGAAEIRRTANLLAPPSLPPDVRVLPLFGALPPELQDQAIAPAPRGTRKVVLATSIAETSLTIAGVRVVVDGGLARVPSFSPRTGMSRLRTIRVSRAAADQRRGRAGRQSAGICYRLWHAEEDAGLLAQAPPEILEADLASLALDLALAGVVESSSLRWLDVPPAPALAQARELLVQLGALADDRRITAHGLEMTRLATHPRLAHMLLHGRALGIGATVCAVAALLEERDALRHDASVTDADLRQRVSLVFSRGEGARAHRDFAHRVRHRAHTLAAALKLARPDRPVDEECGLALALAYPDRIAQRRAGSDNRYLLRNGLGAELPGDSVLHGEPYLAVAELDGRRPEAGIALAAPVAGDEIERLYADRVVTEDVLEWNADTERVHAARRERLGAMVLREVPRRDPDEQAVAHALLTAILDARIALRWSGAAVHMRERLAFLHRHLPGWPDVSDAALLSEAREWLGPRLVGCRSRRDVEAIDLAVLLRERLDWRQRSQLDAFAPTHLTVPSGSRIRVDYSDPGAPSLAVRLQEVFGWTATPSVGGGMVPVTLHLLSPANRPVQVTRDLAGFWRSSYFDVRKELRGRYPKHDWPEDPLSAAARRRPSART
jgi:ATP-dependent helicase HrpB